MFFRALESIRRQPKAVREQYALGLTVALVGSIGLIWLVMLPGRFTNVPTTDAGERGSVRPFSQLLSQFEDEPTLPVAPTAASSTASAPATTSSASAVTLELTPETLRQVASSSRATTSPVQPQPRTVQITTTSEATASSSGQ